MSLDLYIISKTPVKHKGTGIYVRENGQNVELSPERCKELYPDQEFPEFEIEDNYLWHSNITSNLKKMAQQVTFKDKGIEHSLYRLLWHPKEEDIMEIAEDEDYSDGDSCFILNKEYKRLLSLAYTELLSDPDNFSLLNPENGWGSYDTLVNFTNSLLTTLKSIKPKDYSNYILKVSL